jgi:RNA polymerase sigma factor (sigma-70 family)
MDKGGPKDEINPEKLLWNDFRDGNEKAFEDIYKAYVKPLYQYSSKFTPDRDVVLDCIHDLFVDLYHHRQNLGETNNIKLYLFISIKRKIARYLNKNNLYQSFPDGELPFLSDYSTDEDVFDRESEAEIISKLNRALKTLSSRQQEVIYLRFVCGLKYEDICQILDLNYQSVRNLVFRAIEKLRKILVCSALLLLLCH